jgi:hypothetical protein
LQAQPRDDILKSNGKDFLPFDLGIFLMKNRGLCPHPQTFEKV